MQRRKVLFLTATLEVGGSETKIVKIVNALANLGYDAEIAYLNPPETLLEKIDPNVVVTHLRRRGKYSVKSVIELRRLIGDSPTIVFAVNLYPVLYMLPALRVFPRGLSKAVCLVNTTDFVDGQWVWGYLYSSFLKRCDELIYGCRYQKQLWTKKYKLPPERSSYIYNGVDTAFFSPDIRPNSGEALRSQHNISSGAVVIGGIGRLAPEKNFDLLIQAVSRLQDSGRNVHLLLVGNGRERESLQRLAAEYGVSDSLILTGLLEDVRPALSAMDVFVLPSRAVETFSNAALEAMSMARPVVLSNIGGAAEMIESGVNGHLFEIGDLDALVRLLMQLYDSQAERERLGSAARQNVVSNFSFASMLSDYEALINPTEQESAHLS